MAFNLKTLLGVQQLTTGTLCFVAFLFLIIYGVYPHEIRVLYFEMACATASIVNVLLGLESFVLTSKDKRNNRNAYIFDLISSIFLGVWLIKAAQDFAKVYLGDTIMDSEADLWEDYIILMYKISYILGISSAVLLLGGALLVVFMLYEEFIKE